MFWALWNYFRGYVIIRVKGASVEKFLNLAAYKNIFVWDICPNGSVTTMKVSIKGFKKLRECGLKTKCRYKIIKKCGLPFKTHKYNKRKFLMGGILFFTIGLYIMSSFIWTVEINGNERVQSEKIIEYCSQLGLKAGGLKTNINTKTMADEILKGFEDISWVSVSIKGTKAIINIAETIPEPEIINNETPSDIIAAKDGIIVDIAASSGRPLVRHNDTVKKGDILVSGIVELKDGEEVIGEKLVRSKAEVTAKLWYQYSQIADKTYSEKNYTGKEFTDISLIFNDKIINFIKPDMENSSFETLNIYKKYLKIGDYTFPFGIIKDRYICFNEEEKDRTAEQCKEILEQGLNQKIQDLEADGINVVSVDENITENENNFEISATITVIERIDEETQIHIESDEGSLTDGDS